MEFCGIFKPKMLNLIRYNKKLSFYLVEHNFLLSLHRLSDKEIF